MILLGGHSFDFNTDICKQCGVSMVDWIAGKDPNCTAKTQWCCSKPGYDRWNAARAWWECSQCGMTKSNDPNYIYSRGAATQTQASKEAADALKFLQGGFWKIPESSKSCSHRWKTYTGLKETFEYCEVCDLKR